MNDDELMGRLHRLADEDRARAPDQHFWDTMAANVSAGHRRALVQHRRRRWLGGSGAALLAMAAAALLYVRVQHARSAALVEVDDDAEVFQDQDVGELTEGLDQAQLERVADALKKGA